MAYPPPVEEGGSAPEPYEPPTPEEKNAMYAGTDQAMSACRNGIASVIMPDAQRTSARVPPRKPQLSIQSFKPQLRLC